MASRKFKANVQRELAFAESNVNWRNWYLTAAEELDGSIDRNLEIELSAPDILDTYTEAQLVAALRLNLKAERTANEHYTIAFRFGSRVHALEIRRSVAEFHETYAGTPAATIEVTKEPFLGVILSLPL